MNCRKFLRLLAITGLACGLWSGNGSVERASVLEQHPVAIDGKLYRDRGLELVRTDAFSYSPYERADMLGDARATANFIVNYSGFTPQAQAAFQYAVNIWADIVVSAVPIRVDASFAAIGGNTLGQAGSNFLWRDFAGAPPSTFFVDAIADKLHGSDLCAVPANACAGEPDIVAEFNSVPPVPWYFGLDARPPAGTVDFVSVVLHELGHGLGFLGSGRISGGLGAWGLGSPPRPVSYDRYVRNGGGTPFISNPTPSAAALADLTGNNLFFTSPVVADEGAAISAPARLYAPATFQSGSSYSHLEENTYNGTINSLMTPQISQAEAQHNPGSIVREIFSDIGWGPLGSPGGAPGAPGAPTIGGSGNSVNISWTAPASGGAPTSYTLIARGSCGGALITTLRVGNVLAVANISAPNGTFCVSVQASNASGAGPESPGTAFSVPIGPAPPGAPTGLTASTSGQTVTLNWSAPTVGGPPTGYVASVAGPISGVFPLGPGTTVSAPGLPAGSYSLTVSAINAGGQGPASNTATFVIGATAPTMNAPVVNGNAVTLSWANGAGGSTPTGFIVRARQSPAGPIIASLTVGGNSVVVPGVPGGTYFVSVQAFAGSLLSGESNQVTVVVP